eukprot:1151089-Pelagomonas_calceolata.AAC.3
MGPSQGYHAVQRAFKGCRGSLSCVRLTTCLACGGGHGAAQLQGGSVCVYVCVCPPRMQATLRQLLQLYRAAQRLD